MGPARPRGWRQCCLCIVLNGVVLPLGVEGVAPGPAHFSYHVGSVSVLYLDNIAWWPWAKLGLIVPSPYNLKKIKG